MDKAPAYGAGDSGFESQYGLFFVGAFFIFCSPKKMGTMGIEPMTNGLLDQRSTD